MSRVPIEYRTARTDASAFVPVETIENKKLAIGLDVIDGKQKDDGQHGLQKFNYSKQKHATRK